MSDRELLAMVAKAAGLLIEWEPFEETVYHRAPAYRVLLPWLEGVDKDNCAYMDVVFNKYDGVWMARFWHGNRGYNLGAWYDSADAAKQACEERLNQIRKAVCGC